MSPQLGNSPLSERSDHFVDDISDIDDSDSDDDLSPILDDIIVRQHSDGILQILFILMPFHFLLDYSNSPKLCRRQNSQDTDQIETQNCDT